MRQIQNHLWLFLCAFPLLGTAQDNPHWDVKRHQRAYYGEDGIRHQFSYLAEMKEMATRVKRNYAWFDNKVIHTTQGSYSGKLLDGPYREYHINRQLKVQGGYKKGLPKGRWYHWDDGGQLISIRAYHKGKLIKEKFPNKKVEKKTRIPSKRWFRKRQEKQAEVKEKKQDKPKRQRKRRAKKEKKEEREEE